MSVVKAIFFIAFLLVLFDKARPDCYSNAECSGFNDVCCKPNDYNNQCRPDCVGKSCYSHSDCGGINEYCCNYECQEGTCSLPAWIIVIIVLSILGGIGTIVGVAVCFYCAYRRRTPGVILATQPMVTAPATTIVAGSSQVNHPYGQTYPAFQQQMLQSGPPPAYYQQEQSQPTK